MLPSRPSACCRNLALQLFMISSTTQRKFKSTKDAVGLLRSRLLTRSNKLPRLFSLEDYIDEIKQLYRRYYSNIKIENFVIANAYRRLLQLIRQKFSEEQGTPTQQYQGISAAITGIPFQRSTSKSHTEIVQHDHIFTSCILPALDELVDDLESYQDVINNFASSHFFTNEVILVYEYSTTVINFLLSARKVRSFEIIVVESETQELGKQTAEILSKSNLNVTLVPFTNSFAIMQRVNKLLLGVDAILKNGGLLMHPGTNALCLAAKQFSVPVIVLSGAHKLTPKYAFGQDTYNELMSPMKVNQNPHLDCLTIGITYDYVPPEYVSLYITNQGQFNPQSIYQLFNDFYNSNDEDF